MRRTVLTKIFLEMRAMRFRLDDLEKALSAQKPMPVQVPESKLLALPDHLRRTYLVVASRGGCSAAELPPLTGRCRALESNYLNQLSRLGWLRKRREGKTAQFTVIEVKA